MSTRLPIYIEQADGSQRQVNAETGPYVPVETRPSLRTAKGCRQLVLPADGTVKQLDDDDVTGGDPAIPTGALYAEIIATGGDVRWRDDGTDPTTTTGQPILDTGGLRYARVDLAALRLCAATGTAVTLDITYDA